MIGQEHTFRGHTFDLYLDGSGFVGIVKVAGWRYAVAYTNKAKIELINPSSATRPSRWVIAAVYEVAADFAATLTAEWHEANRAMYQEQAAG